MQCKTILRLAIVSSVMIFGSTSAGVPPSQLPTVEPGLTIEAGADQATSLGGSVSLAGAVNKSASIGWAKIEGPGEVVFDEPHSASTSATFSEPGDYTLMLGGYDGDVVWDTVRITVTR